jgi:23S rRNA pseudouridine1911/1915/1917 synthase
MEQTLHVSEADAGARIDAFAAARCPGLSRARAQKLLRQGLIKVAGRPVKASYKVEAGDRITVEVPPPVAPPHLRPEVIPLDIRFEDEDIVVVNKPRGLAVHPGAGRWTGTLVNALMSHCGDLSGIGGELRPGIVHRLDKDTSGLMVVAKHDAAHRSLAAQVKSRAVERGYLALVWGRLPGGPLTVEAPIGRHPTEHKRMAVVREGPSRPAVTEVREREPLGPISLVEARLRTGRTHQIRVHMAYLGHPVVGDPVYGLKVAKREIAALDPQAAALVAGLGGQALHAWRLAFAHPRSGEPLAFTADPPPEMARLLDYLRKKTKGIAGAG